MGCPRCDREYPDGAAECLHCGIIFAKWQARREPPPTPETLPRASLPSPPPAPRFERMVGLVLVVLVGGCWGYLQLAGEPVRDNRAMPTARKPPPAEPETPAGFDLNRGLARLEPLLREIGPEAQAHGVQVSARDLESWFKEGARPLHPAVAIHRAEQAGVRPPDVERWDDADRHASGGGGPTRCLVDGAWVYSHSLPVEGPEGGVSDCWRRQYGNRTEALNSFESITYMGTWLDWWRRYTWQPGNRRWAPFSEADDLSILRHIIDADYSLDAQFEDRAESQRRLEALTESDGQTMHAKWALLEAYKSRVLREGALHRLEHEEARQARKLFDPSGRKPEAP